MGWRRWDVRADACSRPANVAMFNSKALAVSAIGIGSHACAITTKGHFFGWGQPSARSPDPVSTGNTPAPTHARTHARTHPRPPARTHPPAPPAPPRASRGEERRRGGAARRACV